ncbi:hypothetical protein FBEOM_5854 [Fusarium beomiforme]|uniref:Xylanolytic transcriptional activator regulatory domain-containing protein n=1 Tax=Fusarium beomiforme TaxID=44412 RepID=A0A9P5AK17_9HYPO|nr:hypothetical protein FBEOM_5854 [Fusarium beomiforme]
MTSYYGGLGPMLNIVLWIQVVVFAVFVGLRLYTRSQILHSVGADDYLVVIALVLQIIYSAFVTAGTKYGLGRKFADVGNPDAYFKALEMEIYSQVAGLMVIGVGKCAVGIFLLRIVRNKFQKAFIWAFLAGTTFITLFSSIVVVVQCDPVQRTWDRRIPGTCWIDFSKVGLTVGSWFVVADFCFAILPWFVIWELNMKRKEKITVACGLSLGIFAGICGIVRTVALNGLNASEYIYDTVDMLIWSATESTVTIMCSSIPVLRPLYVRFRYGSQGDSSGAASSYKLPMYGNHSGRKYGNGSMPGTETIGGSGPSHRTVVTYNANNASDESILRDTKTQNDISGIRITDEQKKTMNHRDGAQLKNHNVASLSQQVIALQNQVNALTSALQDVSQRLPQITLSSTKSTPQGQGSTYRKDLRNVRNEPREPQFVGPTRSAYSFQIAENSLTGMGIEQHNATGTSTPAESPSETEPVAESEHLSPGIEDAEILPSLGIAEVQRLLDVYNEEIQSVYPFIDVNELSVKAVSVLQNPAESTLKDIQAIKLAVATSVAIEAQGLNNISKRLIDDVEPVICRVSGEAFIDLQELQLMIMLASSPFSISTTTNIHQSIYWFHCGEDLLAWRAIGNAGREALEIGLHRRTSLFENFKDPAERDLAIRCFWCVYIMDRRWSYGTSLSFGISDRDIDPQCPEPGEEHQYLRCMVSYAKLCSKVWEDLPLDSSPFTVPKDKVDFFDFLTQKWIHSIPDDLQLVYPRLSQAPRHQPRVLQRLRTLLYLRGNYIRNLVLRHHVMSAENLRSDMQGAQLVVSLAQDTIQVLVNLNETSDIYARQKATFNYFLTGALASILLAVCHGPDVFADRCRQSFQDAVRLLKNISQHGQLGRRLWRSLKGTIHRALSLESPFTPSGNAAAKQILQQETPEVRQTQPIVQTNWNRGMGNFSMDDNMADMFGLESDLLNLFSAFEQDNMLRPAQLGQVNGGLDQTAAMPDQNGVAQNDDLNRYNGGF